MAEGRQVLTFDRSRRTSRDTGAIDARLHTFQRHLSNQVQPRGTVAGQRLGIRCSVVPVRQMSVPREIIEDALGEPPRRFTLRLRSGDVVEAVVPVHAHNCRTTLWAVRGYFHHEATSYSQEYFLDGTQNLTLVHRPPATGSDAASDDVFTSWALGVTACALRVTAAVCRDCTRPADEFCVEVQVCFAGGGHDAGSRDHRRLLDFRFQSIATTFPRYTFRPQNGPIGVLNSLLTDLYGSVGLRHANPVVEIAPEAIARRP
ncbi:MAG TPA: hypothetical protein VLT59_01145 [Steroidobacteraceae bacterium]|nr:hypothetical protein [Steroidobacteraceae bacterium]